MKATLATLACLLTVGFLSAAEVAGNNTAVVIRKNVVKSDNGYQFLCVPVDGLAIDGTKTTVELSTFLPPATLEVGTTVTIDNKTYTVAPIDGEKKWATKNGTVNEAAVLDLEGGKIFWLHDPVTMNFAALFGSTPTVTEGEGDETEGEGDEPETIIFCGQDRERGDNPARLNQMVAMCNDSSEAITLSAAVTNAAKTDILLTIQDKSSEYRQYIYDGAKWIGPGSQDCSDVEIAPGEAFYYYKRRLNP